MVFDEQAKQGGCLVPVWSLLIHFNLAEPLRADLVLQVTETLSVPLLEKNKRQVFVYIHEMTVNRPLFEEILTLDSPTTKNSNSVDTASEPDSEHSMEEVKRQKPGPTPLTEQYQDSVPLLTDFLRNNVFQAQVCSIYVYNK